MADFFDEFRGWIARNEGDLGDLLSAANEVMRRLKPKADGANTAIATLVNDDAVTVRALLDGIGLAEVAGERALSPEAVTEALAMTVKLAAVVGALA